jgi:hypothetical protein
MKKILVSLIACFCVLGVSAQEWAVGGRVGSGFQAQGEYHFSDTNYAEARFGMYYANPGGTVMADLTALYNWNIFNMDWTPSVGEWFFDAGCGINVGGRENYAYIGAAGCAKLGIKFHDAPIRLSFDWTPSFGAEIAYWKGYSASDFNEYGLCNFGISCVYCF